MSAVLGFMGGPRLDVATLARDRDLWVDRRLAEAVPVVLLGVAVEFAAECGPLAVTRPGRLELLGAPWPLGAAYGRTVRGVQLHDARRPLSIGTVVEVDERDPAPTLAHELMHVRGVADHVEAERLGGLLVRGAARR
jgi:hypothetical protein